MEMIARLQYFTAWDALAVGFLLITWLASGYRIENPAPGKPSVSVLMGDYRREWMVQMVSRQPRIFDATILNALRQGTAFFASACLIGIGGGLALIGNTERLLGVAEDLTLDAAPAIVWEVKILFVLLLVANALLKFIWSHRLFGYCAVVMASVPNDVTAPHALSRAGKAAELNVSAARAFNRGLRSMYFSLGALAWLLGPLALVVATLVTLMVLWRREFASGSRRVLMEVEVSE